MTCNGMELNGMNGMNVSNDMSSFTYIHTYLEMRGTFMDNSDVVSNWFVAKVAVASLIWNGTVAESIMFSN